MLGIEHKTAVITGGSQGLGKAMAHELGAYGARIVIGSRSEDAGNRAAAELRAAGIQCVFHQTDVTNPERLKDLVGRAVKEYGRIDFMVNNAGIFIGGPPTELAVADWKTVVDVNLNGAFYGCQAAGRKMIEQGGGGRIVNVSSVIGVAGKLLCSAYAASKSGLNGLTKNLAADLAPHDILVNAIVPGVCDSEINAHVSEPDRRRSETRIPLRRWALPVEIARGVVYLCSDLATYVTGTTLVVDGGYLIGSEITTGDSIL